MKIFRRVVDVLICVAWIFSASAQAQSGTESAKSEGSQCTLQGSVMLCCQSGISNLPSMSGTDPLAGYIGYLPQTPSLARKWHSLGEVLEIQESTVHGHTTVNSTAIHTLYIQRECLPDAPNLADGFPVGTIIIEEVRPVKKSKKVRPFLEKDPKTQTFKFQTGPVTHDFIAAPFDSAIGKAQKIVASKPQTEGAHWSAQIKAAPGIWHYFQTSSLTSSWAKPPQHPGPPPPLPPGELVCQQCHAQGSFDQVFTQLLDFPPISKTQETSKTKTDQ